MIPLLRLIDDAKQAFHATYGFPAEKMHVSPRFEQVLHRWAAKHLPPRDPNNFDGAEIAGLEILQSTKKHTTMMEFWLTTTRGGQVFAQHRVLDPNDFGMRNRIIQGESLIETTEASYEDLDLTEFTNGS